MMMTKIKERNRSSTVLNKSASGEQHDMYLRNSATQENEAGLTGAFFIRRMRKMKHSGTIIVEAGLRRRYPSLSGNNVVELAQVSF